MITRPITVTLRGTPAPAGSLKCVGRHGRHQLVQDFRPGQDAWKKLIAETFREGVAQTADQYQPVGVEVTFTVHRPDSHYGTGRNKDRLRDNAPTFPTRHNTGDTDKLLRLLDDALQTAGLVIDDAQIVDVHARKAYPGCPHTPGALDHPGAQIRVYPIGGTS